MKIKIISCCDPNFWYNNMIGVAFEVNSENEFNYITVDNIPGYDCNGYISKCDCIVVPNTYSQFDDSYAIEKELLRREQSIETYNGYGNCKNCNSVCHPSKTRFAEMVNIWGYYICVNCDDTMKQLRMRLDKEKKTT